MGAAENAWGPPTPVTAPQGLATQSSSVTVRPHFPAGTAPTTGRWPLFPDWASLPGDCTAGLLVAAELAPSLSHPCRPPGFGVWEEQGSGVSSFMTWNPSPTHTYLVIPCEAGQASLSRRVLFCKGGQYPPPPEGGSDVSGECFQSTRCWPRTQDPTAHSRCSDGAVPKPSRAAIKIPTDRGLNNRCHSSQLWRLGICGQGLHSWVW